MRLSQLGRGLRIEARLLKDNLFRKIGSTNTELLLLKEISKEQCGSFKESTIYVREGSVVMTQDIYLGLGDNLVAHRLPDFYKLVVARNLQDFHQFLNKHTDAAGNFLVGEAGSEKLEQELLLSQILSTTTSTFGVAEESNQFRQMESSLARKKQDIRSLREHIVDHLALTASSGLYCKPGETVNPGWIRSNFEHAYSSNEKRFGSLLAMSRFAGTKRIDDYVFNTVKVNIRETTPKPVNQGGSCLIFIAKASISFISSVDSSAYPQVGDNR
jgi:hypothetical protein